VPCNRLSLWPGACSLRQIICDGLLDTFPLSLPFNYMRNCAGITPTDKKRHISGLFWLETFKKSTLFWNKKNKNRTRWPEQTKHNITSAYTSSSAIILHHLVSFSPFLIKGHVTEHACCFQPCPASEFLVLMTVGHWAAPLQQLEFKCLIQGYLDGNLWGRGYINVSVPRCF